MKATEGKNKSTHASQAAGPFFGREQGDGFFSETAEPFFAPAGAQAKLTVGRPGDRYEQEADAMADRVVHGLKAPTAPPPVQTKCEACEQEEKVQKAEEEEGEDVTVMRKPGFEIEPDQKEKLHPKAFSSDTPPTTNLESRLRSAQGKGRPLSEPVRSSMEAAFGADFGAVQVHTSPEAVQMNRDLQARAFTHGTDVFFNQGQYQPDASAGKHLLAHELTHVVQQTGSAQTRRVMRARLDEAEPPADAARDLRPPSARAGDNRAIFRKEIDDFQRTYVPGARARQRVGVSASPRSAGPDGRPPTLQRQHKLENDLGSAAGVTCPISTEVLSHPDASLDITFDLGGSILTAEDITNITVFVNNWQNAALSVPVRIHGYASIDGPPTVNWPLSCQRAEAVSKQMQKVQPAAKLSTGQTFPAGTPGIPAGFIQVLAHGETEEFSKTALEPNRRATVHVPSIASLPAKVAAAPSAKLKSGPTYTPNGSIPVTKTKTSKAAPFTMAAEFENDPAKGLFASCGEIRQYIRWSNDDVDPRRFNHEGFLTDKTYLPNTWYEDRGQNNIRYGHRRGPHFFNGGVGNQYLDAKGKQDFLKGAVFQGRDRPNVGGPAAFISSFVGTWEFKITAIDTCNGNKVLGEDNLKVVW